MAVVQRKPISRRLLFFHYSSLLVFLAIVGLYPARGIEWLAYPSLVVLITTTAFTVFLLAHRGTAPAPIIAAMIVHAVVVISFFALIFYHAELVTPTGKMRPDLSDAFYFSIVTWTTLGYGDFQPPAGLRLFAAMEAITGYVYLGLIVGLATNLFKMPARP